MTITNSTDVGDHKFALFGGISIDRLGYASHPILSDSSTPGVFHEGLGGVAANVAMSLAKFNNRVTLCGIVGEDSDSELVLRKLEQMRINQSGISRSSKFPTPVYLAIHQTDGKLKNALADTRLTETMNADCIDWSTPGIDHAKVWFMDTNLNKTLIEHIAKNANDRILACNTVSIAKSTKLANYLNFIDFLFANKAEASALLNQSFPDAESAAVALIEAGAKSAIVSDGLEPIVMATRQKSNEIGMVSQQPIPSRILDVTGAGDVMSAMVLHGSTNGWDQEKTLGMAAAAASVCLECHGVSPESLDLNTIELRYLDWQTSQ